MSAEYAAAFGFLDLTETGQEESKPVDAQTYATGDDGI